MFFMSLIRMLLRVTLHMQIFSARPQIIFGEVIKLLSLWKEIIEQNIYFKLRREAWGLWFSATEASL
jgi:hypothetical protein